MSMPETGERAMMPAPHEMTVDRYPLHAPQGSELLVATEASAISAGTELAVYTGIHQWLNDPTRTWPRFPFVPGYSGVGRVIATGQDVQGYAVGDRVIWEARHESHAIIDLAHAPLIRTIGDTLPADVAAFAVLARFPLTAVVQSGAVMGQGVAVFGLGLIGQIALRLYAAAGAYPLYGIDTVAQRRAIAETIPGVRAIDPGAGDLGEQLRAANSGALPEITVDATGAPNAVKSAMRVVADGGKVIMVGSPRGIAGDVDFYWDLHGRSIQLIGAHGSAIGTTARERFPFVRDRALRLLVHLLETGRLDLTEIITHRVRGDALKPVYDGLLNDRDAYIGVAVHWG